MIFEENVPNESLRRARHRKGWTQSELAESVGTDFETVSRWERGITVPSAYFREQLSAALEKTPQELGLLVDHDAIGSFSISSGVFLAASYADAEGQFVIGLKAHLLARDISVFSPRSLRRQGAEHQRKAWQEALRTAQAVLLIVSPEARSSRHVQKALQMAGIYKRPVCAIWIDGASWQACVPPNCGELFATVDARQDDGRSAFDEIVAKLEQVRPVSREMAVSPAPTNDSVEPLAEPRNPYKGLQAFHGEDQGDFFGRDVLVGELAGALNACLIVGEEHTHGKRLLAVIGPSGSGKSSVVMAGLLPRLQRGGLPGSQEWVYLEPMLPGSHPIESLAVALAKHLPQRSLKTIRDDLEDDSAYGLHSLANCLRKTPVSRVVLLIDQFEEVFTQTISEDERQHFIDLLVMAVTEPRGSLILILTLRADFYDRPMNYPELSTLIQSNQILVPPMDLKELREVIEKPAALPDVQLTFEGDLVSDLLFDVQEQVGALPLLQFTLDQLFQRRSGHQITLTTYHEISGVKGAVARHAEATYASLPSEEHRKLARVLFLRLIEPGATVQETTRRRITSSELQLSNPKETVIIDEVLRAFTTARLLTTSTSSAGSTVEVSHEAVIREWTRLSDWLDEAREDVHHQHTISQDATAWVQHGKPQDRLYRGTQLKEAQAWARRNTSSGSEVTFLRASIAHQRRSYVGMAAILLLLVLLMGLIVQPFIILAIAELRLIMAPTVVTTLKDSGPGSLRQAIAQAEPNSTITFEAGLRGRVLLTDSLDIAKSLTIRGPGAGVLSINSGKNIYRVNVHPSASVTISGLTFQNSTDSGIFNEGLLILTDSVISHNTSIAGAGGGIYNHGGRLTLINSVVSHNTASGLYSSGGGIYNDEGTLMLMNSVISDNESFGNIPGADGGGIYNSNGGTLTLTNSIVSGNMTSSWSDGDRGGGIANFGTLTITTSTISGNKASWEGGGIVTYSDSTLTLTDSTVSGNTVSASFGDGGGLANGPNTRITLTNSTISDNTSSGGGGGISNFGSWVNIEFCTIYGNKTDGYGGGLFIEDGQDDNGKTVSSQINISRSIVAGNRANTGPDIAGTLTSHGYNLIQDISGATFAASQQHLTDIMVGPHADLRIDPGLSGKQPQEHALLSGSPAIDKLPLSACLVDDISTDERGAKRPDGQEQFCDIGAYEYVDV